MKTFETGDAIIARHGDKGSWKIDADELRASLPPEQAQLVQTVISEEFPGMTDTPLTKEGILRSLALAESMHDDLPPGAVVVFSDSGKERAQLTRALVAGRVQQIEEHGAAEGKQPKLLDVLRVDSNEIARLLEDSHDATWTPYGAMVSAGTIEFDDALARWVNDMNKPNANIPADQHPRESSERYRTFLKLIKEKVQTAGKDAEIPVVFLGIGHSGSLEQVAFEEKGVDMTGEESPQYCEMFVFDKHGALIKRQETEI